jgi:fatty acid desaturase
MTTNLASNRPDAEVLKAFEHDLNKIREETMAKIGQKDARYIRNVIRVQRSSDLFGRLALVLGFFNPLFWIAGVALLALSKILDNMEIGHNIMHGQYDWMNDPHINSRKFDWDIWGDGESWKRYHNHEHHTYTNIIGKDRDYGYGLLRLSDDIGWRPKNRFQFITYTLLSSFFQFGIAYHEVAGERIFGGKRKEKSSLPISREALKHSFFAKIKKQVFKEYLFFPLLAALISWPMFFAVLAGNMIAEFIRNWWTSSVIFCGHFTEDAQTFDEKECENETRGEWYYRQILGSSNFSGSRAFHILTGHLSCQVEHHLFPDVPAYHYVDMAKQVQVVCKKYNIPYNTGSFAQQYWTVLKRVAKYSFPTKEEQRLAINSQ